MNLKSINKLGRDGATPSQTLSLSFLVVCIANIFFYWAMLEFFLLYCKMTFSE